MSGISVPIQLEIGAQVPSYKTPQAAGADLFARLEAPLALKPGDRYAVPTGISIALPDGYEAQVRPRSGLALNHGLTCLNSPGTIDADYRGEIKVIIINLGHDEYTIRDGDRIAQLVVAQVCRIDSFEIGELDLTPRGESGFGSTGR